MSSLDSSFKSELIRYLPWGLASKCHIEFFETLGSTNDHLKSSPLNTAKLYHVCIANEQTSGRGSYGKTWHSPADKNLYLSVALPLTPSLPKGPFSLITGYALAEVLNRHFDIDAGIKWPNDLLCRENKIAGILTEYQSESTGGERVIIGIGLNVNMEKLPASDHISSWSSLALLTGCPVDRPQLAALIIQALDEVLTRYQHSGFDGILEDWSHYDALKGREISLEVSDGVIRGAYLGINHHGALIMRLPSGTVHSFERGSVVIE